jgi:hypothetical protein
MNPFVPDNRDGSQIAIFAAALVERFGSQSLVVAQKQANNSTDDVAATWRMIGKFISMHHMIAARAPDDLKKAPDKRD